MFRFNNPVEAAKMKKELKKVFLFHLLEFCQKVINPYKPSVLFIGHRQTAQTQIRCHRIWHLIRVSTVCSQNVLLEFE